MIVLQLSRPLFDSHNSLTRDYIQERTTVTYHRAPSLLSAVIVVASLELAGIITLESSLSFLGLGIQPPTVSWGYMLADGRTYLLGGAWWVVTFPGLAITATILSINILADWLRDVLDPRLKI